MTKKIYFKMLFDISNGNPNGDPDMNNRPRTILGDDGEYGYMTNQSIGWKIRDRVFELCTNKKDVTTLGGEVINCKNGYDIYVKSHREKDDKRKLIEQIYLSEHPNIKKMPNYKISKNDSKADKIKKIPIQKELIELCKKTFFDVRMFGDLINWGENGGAVGAVKGALVLSSPKSIDPINVIDTAITQETHPSEKGLSMGRKFEIDYGLYICDGTISNWSIAENKNGITENDIKILKYALLNLEGTNSQTRKIKLRKIYFYEVENDNVTESTMEKMFTIKKLVNKPLKYEDYEIVHNDALCNKYGIKVDKVKDADNE